MVSGDHSGAIEFNVGMTTNMSCEAMLRNKGLRYSRYLARDSSTNTYVKDLNEHFHVEYR